VPAEVVAALRAGFDKTMEDKDFLAFAKKVGLDLQPMTGAQVQDVIAEIYRTSHAAVEKAKAMIK
jgi:tripartite-type tricarboxylate transporter receptor subunit TctC